jgi:hypothetical protein
MLLASLIAKQTNSIHAFAFKLVFIITGLLLNEIDVDQLNSFSNSSKVGLYNGRLNVL